MKTAEFEYNELLYEVSYYVTGDSDDYDIKATVMSIINEDGSEIPVPEDSIQEALDHFYDNFWDITGYTGKSLRREGELERYIMNHDIPPIT